MINIGTTFFIKDNSGIKLIKCIGILNKKEKKLKLGDIIIGSILKSTSLEYPKSMIIKALVVKTKKKFIRKDGSTISFNTNSAILINDELVMKSTKVFGAIPYEIKNKCKKISGSINIII